MPVTPGKKEAMYAVLVVLSSLQISYHTSEAEVNIPYSSDSGAIHLTGSVVCPVTL